MLSIDPSLSALPLRHLPVTQDLPARYGFAPFRPLEYAQLKRHEELIMMMVQNEQQKKNGQQKDDYVAAALRQQIRSLSHVIEEMELEHLEADALAWRLRAVELGLRRVREAA